MIVWSFVDFGSGSFRLARVEAVAGSDNVMMDLTAEQPWGSLVKALKPYGLTPAKVAWEAALARQKREEDLIP